MASVVLQRVFVDDDDLNSELAMAVLNDHPGTYARLIMPYFEDEDDGDVDSAELAEIVASAKEPETAHTVSRNMHWARRPVTRRSLTWMSWPNEPCHGIHCGLRAC